jgi:hypothetical protein
MSRFLVGIDLGTTNSAVAYIDLQNKPRVGSLGEKTFAVPQLVAAGQMGDRALLPSFLYLPGQHDLQPGAVALPWKPSADFAVGEFARNHGAKIPGRLVSSAKSWLCHPGVDRTSPLLPWAAPPDVPRLSPLEVSMRYLAHMVESWNHLRKEHPLQDQAVVLTVPASFDDVARNLTMEAAKQAGLKNVVLLEEPQAAFYCWLGLSKIDEVTQMKPGMRCLVVDVGGGTSDFSLIQAAEDKGELTFIREAVGDHLLLGGDNMDLALARHAETKLPQAGRLDAAQFGMLVQSCRQAKEVLLAPNAPDKFSVTIMGRGRSVIGGSLHTHVTLEDVKRVIFEGFFPHTPRDGEPQRAARTGLQEMGLPYVSDPAVTRHLASFLKRQLPPDAVPDTILFNGGVFQPQALRDRLIEVMHLWYDQPGKPWQPLILSNPSLDLAVAWGAAYFGWLRHTGGRRIGGGIPRSYYIGIETTSESKDKTVLCVIPRRLEEGVDVPLPKPELELALGQPVLFPLFTSTVRGDDKPGDLLQINPDQLLQLPPLHTILKGGKRSGTKRVPVTLQSRLSEIGTLELYCQAKDGDNRWRLEFNVRDIVKDSPEGSSEGSDTSAIVDVLPEEQIQTAASAIRSSFQDKTPASLDPKELTKSLETTLESSRNDWPMGLCRRLWEFFEEVAEERGRSGSHLSRWYNLVGFSLRPGFGDSLDRYRVDQLWKMLAAFKSASASSGQPSEGGADYWIMWRRVSGGLSAGLQLTLFNKMRPVLLPNKGKNAPKPSLNELTEMWRAAASLERLDVKIKESLGAALLKQIQRGSVPSYAFWALTRIGSRSLLYGPLNSIVHPEIVETWLAELLSFEPSNDHERTTWTFCLSQLSRLTGQRAIDLNEEMRQRVIVKLKSLSVSADWIRSVEEIIEVQGAERSQMFGESLPIGLRLIGT